MSPLIATWLFVANPPLLRRTSRRAPALRYRRCPQHRDRCRSISWWRPRSLSARSIPRCVCRSTSGPALFSGSAWPPASPRSRPLASTIDSAHPRRGSFAGECSSLRRWRTIRRIWLCSSRLTDLPIFDLLCQFPRSRCWFEPSRIAAKCFSLLFATRRGSPCRKAISIPSQDLLRSLLIS